MTAQTNWHWGISNAGLRDLLLWLEPWAEEHAIPSRSTAMLKVIRHHAEDLALDIEETDDHIVIWGNGGELIEVYIDGILQDTGSAAIKVPDDPSLPTKHWLRIIFSDQPAARLAGRPLPKPSMWQKFRRRLGL